jgi:hypothetical protein
MCLWISNLVDLCRVMSVAISVLNNGKIVNLESCRWDLVLDLQINWRWDSILDFQNKV